MFNTGNIINNYVSSQQYSPSMVKVVRIEYSFSFYSFIVRSGRLLYGITIETRILLRSLHLRVIIYFANYHFMREFTSPIPIWSVGTVVWRRYGVIDEKYRYKPSLITKFLFYKYFKFN